MPRSPPHPGPAVRARGAADDVAGAAAARELTDALVERCQVTCPAEATTTAA